MALVLKAMWNSYNYYFNTAIDSRSQDWFLVQSPPISISLILIGYVIMISNGPKLMEAKNPYELKFIMMIYNLFQVVSNLALGVYAGYFFFIKHNYSFRCQPVYFDNGERGRMELILCYCYFLLKILDLFDTAFIILRKKSSHLSFLHCYHHFGMALGSYICVRWVPGGHPLLLGFVNAFVHAFMYFYYFLTALKPELKKSMWWKKHITQIQLTQFAILASAFFIACFSKNCDYPKFWLWVLVIQNFFMFSLFADFYRKTYWKKQNMHKIQ